MHLKWFFKVFEKKFQKLKHLRNFEFGVKYGVFKALCRMIETSYHLFDTFPNKD